jgi:hypothetical protein
VTLCELEQTGIFGWADISMWVLTAFLSGGWLMHWAMTRLHRVELLAALEIGRRERR